MDAKFGEHRQLVACGNGSAACQQHLDQPDGQERVHNQTHLGSVRCVPFAAADVGRDRRAELLLLDLREMGFVDDLDFSTGFRRGERGRVDLLQQRGDLAARSRGSEALAMATGEILEESSDGLEVCDDVRHTRPGDTLPGLQ